MPETKLRRGRPKGSGIDDRPRLRQLAALLRDKPDLKPTTAIRALGIKDPSAIRRLRDKFHLCRSELMSEFALPAPVAPPVPVAPARPARAPAPAPVRRALAAAQAAPAKKLAPVPAAAPRAPEPAAMRAAEIPPALPLPAAEPAPAARRTREFDRTGGDWMTAWCGLGLQAMTRAVAVQVEFTQQVARLPPMTAALRHHLALSELAFALYASGARVAAAR
jgi:hypothetical protein